MALSSGHLQIASFQGQKMGGHPGEGGYPMKPGWDLRWQVLIVSPPFSLSEWRQGEEVGEWKGVEQGD